MIQSADALPPAPGPTPQRCGAPLLLLRHGRTEWNARTLSGPARLRHSTRPGSRARLAAAVAVAPSPSVLVGSPAGRRGRALDYREHARRARLEPADDPRLREIHLGRGKGLTRAEAASERTRRSTHAWRHGEDTRRRGYETYAEVGVRAADRAVDAARHGPAGGLLVAVTHGGTVRATIGTLLAMQPDDVVAGPRRWANCRWSVLPTRAGASGWRSTTRREPTSAGDRATTLATGSGPPTGPRATVRECSRQPSTVVACISGEPLRAVGFCTLTSTLGLWRSW